MDMPSLEGADFRRLNRESEREMTHKPTDESRRFVEVLTANGISQSRVSEHLEIDEKTLRHWYRHELDLGLESINARVASNLIRIATRTDGGMPSVIACLGWLKCRAGYSEKSRAEIAFAEPWNEDVATSAREKLLAKINEIAERHAAFDETQTVEDAGNHPAF